VRLRVSPGAKTTGLRGLHGEEAVRIRVAAPPADGKANAEVERFLVGLLALARGAVSVVGGASSRNKTVLLEGVEPREARRLLTTSGGTDDGVG